MVGPCWLSLLNIAVHTCQSQTPNLSVPLPSNHKFIVKVWICFCLIKKFIYGILLDSMYKWYYMIFVFVWLTSFTVTISMSHPCCCKWHYFLLGNNGWVIFHVYTHCICFIHSPVEGHLGCVHVLAIVNSVTKNTGMHVSFWTIFFSGYKTGFLTQGFFRTHNNVLFDNHCFTIHIFSLDHASKMVLSLASLFNSTLFINKRHRISLCSKLWLVFFYLNGQHKPSETMCNIESNSYALKRG